MYMYVQSVGDRTAHRVLESKSHQRTAALQTAYTLGKFELLAFL